MLVCIEESASSQFPILSLLTLKLQWDLPKCNPPKCNPSLSARLTLGPMRGPID